MERMNERQAALGMMLRAMRGVKSFAESLRWAYIGLGLLICEDIIPEGEEEEAIRPWTSAALKGGGEGGTFKQ